MKIAVTGTTKGFGKYLLDNWGKEVISVNLRKGVDYSFNIIKNCDVFINHAYNNTDQSNLFGLVFNEWFDKSKTIINFGSSAIYNESGFAPKYVSDKKHLNFFSKSLAMTIPDKKVRVVNFNPSTLENNTMFPNFNTLSFSSLASIVKFIIELPQEVEISELCIKSTSLNKKKLF